MVTVMQLVIAPVLHSYDADPAGTHNSVDCPPQIVRSPVMEQAGKLSSVTVALQTLVQPFASVTVTE